MLYPLYLGLDLGGTNVRALLVEDAREGVRMRGRAEQPTPPSGGEDVVVALVEAAQEALRAASVDPSEVAAIGCASPGPLDPRGGVVHQTQNIARFTNFPLGARLQSAFGASPVFVDRDTVSAAIGERFAGAAKGVDDFVYVTVSTGIGGAAVSGGHMVRGASGTAGEIGHQAVSLDPLASPRCRCGSYGCVEAYAAGANLAERFGVGAAEDVFAAARAGDGRARRLVEEAAFAVGNLAVGLVNVLNPRLLVVGGSIAEHEPEHVLGTMRAHIAERAFRMPATAVRVVPPALGGDVGTMGAALEARERAAGRDAWFL